MGNRARGLLAIWREEEIAYVAEFFLEDIRNLKGKVDVFCFVYRASTATSMLKPGINYICIHLYNCSMYVHACRVRIIW